LVPTNEAHGLIEALNEDELSGVLAFELSVIAEGVTLANGVAAVLAYFLLSFVPRPRKRQPRWRQGICTFSYFIFGSLAAAIVRFLASRKKVFGADERSARTLRTSKGLVSALHRIETLNQDYAFLIHESFHHLFMIPPVGRERSVLRLFDNHPTTDKRIERLSQLDVNLALR
jgi:heat shock protein HtpX